MTARWKHPARSAGPLSLEPIALRHAAALAHQYRDPDTACRTGLPPITGPQDATRWIARQHSLSPATYAWMHHTLGFVGYGELLLEADTASLCLWIGCDHRGKGFGIGLVNALCRAAWDNGMRRVLSAAYTDNTASLRTLRKAGFMAFDASPCGFDARQRRLICSPTPVSAEEARQHLVAFCRRRAQAV